MGPTWRTIGIGTHALRRRPQRGDLGEYTDRTSARRDGENVAGEQRRAHRDAIIRESSRCSTARWQDKEKYAENCEAEEVLS